MQSQDYGPAKWSIGQRAKGLVDADVDAALADGSIIRTHVLRPTWHFVARDDARWLLTLSGPRVQKLLAPRYRELGLDGRTLSRCEKVVADALTDRQLTRKELGRILKGKRVDVEGQRLPHILSHCELEMLICSGALAGKQHTYALFDDRVGTRGTSFDRSAAVAELTLRYLAGHGPATVQDLRWWSGLTAGDINEALAALDDRIESATVGGVTLWSVGGDDRSAPRKGADLLQTYDELIVGYSESRYLGDPRAEQARAAWRDRGVPGATVLVNGAVAGHWKRAVRGSRLEVEIVTYDRPSQATERALRAAVDELGRFLQLQPRLTLARIKSS